MTLLDTLLSEYSWPTYAFRGQQRGPDDWVIWHVPLARAFAFYAAIAARMGCEIPGPTYQEQAMLKAKREAEEKWEKKGGAF